MASFLTDLAKTYVEKLINGAIAESSYICCFTCIAKDFEEEKERLEVERTTFKQRVDVATRKGEDLQRKALFWEDEAEKLVREETKTKQKCLFGVFPHCIWRYRRGKDLANKTEQIKNLIETGRELAIGLPARLPDIECYSLGHYISFESRESKYKELLDALKDDNNYIIGLHGMGGTGKTTLAKEVGKELKQSKQFTHVIDTTVSYTPDYRKIQNDIAGPLGLDFKDCSESDRSKKLWSRLTNGEKILLILDDLWGDINFDEIGIPDIDNHKGCRILLTTRNLPVCNKLGCSKKIQLELLSEKDAWIMFKRYAGLNEISNKYLLRTGRQIANECKGLPIAIAAIASSLKGEQRPEEWDMALKSLQKNISMHDVDDELVKIYQCLNFSYINMKNEKAKRLFLLCSIFPEDEEIDIEVLTRLGIGGGLFGEDYGSYEDARSQVVISKNKLLDSCLLLEASQYRVKMHDLVRDVAQWIANKEIQTVMLEDKNQKARVERNKNIKYLFYEGIQRDLFSCKLDSSKLEILIVTMYVDDDCHDENTEVLNSLFENNSGLRVFSFSCAFFHGALSLPQSIQSLKNIRSLFLNFVDLGDISILGNLQSLETLEFIHCKINELPHKITKLEKLRLLNLSHCDIARNNPFEVIEGCSSLEELYFTASFNEFCREITFPELQRFRLNYYSKDDLLLKCVSLVDNDEVFLSETTLKYCMKEAEVLRLRRIDVGWRNIIPDIVPVDQGMNHLIELGLICFSQLQCLIDIKDTESQVLNVFSKLVVLDLCEFENLKELCNGPLSFDSLKRLEKLTIKDCKSFQSLFKCNLNLCNLKSVYLEGCPMLISVFQLSTAHSMTLLESLTIIDCGHLEYIIDERMGEESRGKIVDVDNDNTSHGSMFQKLKVIWIEGCPRIELILPLVSARDFPALESIAIKSCDKLQYIFGKDVTLDSLTEMQLHSLPNWIDIFPECKGITSLSINRSSSIFGDASKTQAQSDPIKCRIFSWASIYCCGKKYGHKLRSTTSTKFLPSEDQPCNKLMESNSYHLNIWEHAQCLSRQSHIMFNIKEIKLWNISNIKSVFILSIAPRMLLETLWIICCNELKHIIIDTGDLDNTGGNDWDTVFPNLRNVIVKDCKQLEYIVGHYTDHHKNHIEIHLHLSALECLDLSHLPSLVGMCPKQYHTTFPPLEELYIIDFSQFAIKSIGDFITHHSETRSVDNTLIKELSENVEHFISLKRLMVDNNSKVESIFCLNEINEEEMNLGFEVIDLYVLPMMQFLFVGPKNSSSLQNLTRLKIMKCEKLKTVFSTSIIRCLPQLLYMRIEDCKELNHMIEDDLENKSTNFLSTKTCFPKLKTLVVQKCNQLKYVFPISICKELPELDILMIREADELEEIFVSECDDQKVEIPNMKFVVFENLPSLCHVHGIQFQAVKHHLVQNCQKLSLASASAADLESDIRHLEFGYDYELYGDLRQLFNHLSDTSKGHDTCNEYPNSEITEVEATSGHNLTSSQKEMEQPLGTGHEFVENVPQQEMPLVPMIPTNSEELMNEQRPLPETDASVKPSQENNLEGSTSEKNIASTLSTISETTRNDLPIQLVSPKKKGIELSVEEGTTSANAKTIIPSPHSKSLSSSLGQLDTSKHKTTSQEDGDGQVAIDSPPITITMPVTTQDVDVKIWQETSKTNDDQVSLNDPTAMKVSSNIEDEFSKDDEFRVSEPKPCPSNKLPLHLEFQTPSIPSEGNSSKIMESSSSPSIVMWELQQLVSDNYLDYQNLSLLTDFLVKHPSILLKDTSLSNRYKGYAYGCLADLLQLLQTHSVLDVLGSSRSKFVKLLQDVRSFAFDKAWLDSVERRALFPDIQVSQDEFQKLLDSKQQVSKEVEVLRFKIDVLSENVEDLKRQLTSSETVLKSIIQKEAQVLETRAALSAPLGY